MTLVALRQRLTVSLNGAVQEGIDVELLATLRDFCAKTGVWRVIDDVVTTTGVRAYTPAVPAASQLRLIDQVYMGDQMLSPISEYGQTHEPAGPYFQFDESLGQILVFQEPNDKGLTVYAWLTPTSLTGAPAFLWTLYDEAIIAGAMASMMMQPNKPYTNPNLGQYSQRKYLNRVTEAKRRMLTSSSRADVAWRFPLATRSRALR